MCNDCYFNQDGICKNFEGLYFNKEASYRCPEYLKGGREYSLKELIERRYKDEAG